MDIGILATYSHESVQTTPFHKGNDSKVDDPEVDGNSEATPHINIGGHRSVRLCHQCERLEILTYI